MTRAEIRNDLAATPPVRQTVIVCISPKSGSGQGRERIAGLRAELQRRNLEVVCTSQLEQVQARLAELDPRQVRAVVPVGGDGTIRLVAATLPPGTPLVPFPMGTENLLSRHFGYRADPRAAAAAVVDGQCQQFDAGRANGRLFLVMASCGFDAEVARAMHLGRKGHIVRWSYAKPIVRTMRKYRYPPISITVRDGEPPLPSATRSEADREAMVPEEEPLECRWAFIFNLPCYAGGLRIAPESRGDDGRLNLCALRRGSTWSTLRYLSGVLLGRHHRYRDVVRQAARQWWLSSPARVAYQLDGDYVGRLPLHVECLPGRLTLRLPVGDACLD